MADGKVVIDTELDGSGAESGMQKLGGTLGKVGGAAVGGVKAAVGVATAAISGAAVAIGGLVTASVNAYASYEQLVGGVDTLFKDSSKKVQAYANVAYKTAGMSANQYMETVTGFSASLLQSLGGDTAKAAEYANSAVIDMSDNANKMGTDIEMIQNAYGGFAKQNYTMLDNLKLGYGGTKEEMQRLLEDAEKISGVKYDISSYADVTQAIHVMQESMGIAGTTAKEASSTIQGSVSAMKSSWSNLLVGMADDSQDIGPLVDNFVASVGTVMENIIPIATQAMGSITGMIESLMPIIVEQIPILVEQLLPTLLMAAASILGALGQAIIDNGPVILDAFSEIFDSLMSGIATLFPPLQPLIDIIMLLKNNLDSVLAVVIPLVAAFVAFQIAMGISSLISGVSAALDGMTIAQYALNLAMSLNPIGIVVALIVGLIAAIIYLWNTNEGFRNAIISIFTNIGNVITFVVGGIISLFTEKIPSLVSNVLSWFNQMPDGIKKIFTNIWEIITFVVDMIVSFFTVKIPKLVSDVLGWFSQIPDGIKKIFATAADIGKGLVDGIWKGISDGWDWLTDKVGDLAQGLIDTAKKVLGIHSPSKEFAWIGQMSAEGMVVGFDDVDPVGEIKSSIAGSLGNIQTNVSAMDSGKNSIVSSAISSIANGTSYAGDLVFKIGETEVARTLLSPLLSEMNRQGYDVEVIGG